MDSVSRRRFITISLGTIGASVLIAACGTDDSGTASDETDTDTPKIDANTTAPVIGVVSSDLYASPTPQRVVFALALGTAFINAGDANVSVLEEETGEEVTTATATYREEGLGEGRGLYSCDLVLPTAGNWILKVVPEKGLEPTPSVAVVAEQSSTLTVGSAAPTAASPTTTDSLGVDPLCTRSPECDLHEHSLSELVGNGTPLVVLFATPARCQSQYCGPALEIVLDTLKESAFANINAVHVEIYKDDVSTDLVPTLEAWTLQSEPWLFCLDGNGTVVSRLDGGFDKSAVRTAVQTLL